MLYQIQTIRPSWVPCEVCNMSLITDVVCVEMSLFSFIPHFLEDFEMDAHDMTETNDPISIQQAELRQKDEQADVEAIHDVRLLSLHTAQLKFQSPPSPKKNLKDAKQSETTVFDSFDEFCKS